MYERPLFDAAPEENTRPPGKTLEAAANFTVHIRARKSRTDRLIRTQKRGSRKRKIFCETGAYSATIRITRKRRSLHEHSR